MLNVVWKDDKILVAVSFPTHIETNAFLRNQCDEPISVGGGCDVSVIASRPTIAFDVDVGVLLQGVQVKNAK